MNLCMAMEQVQTLASALDHLSNEESSFDEFSNRAEEKYGILGTDIPSQGEIVTPHIEYMTIQKALLPLNQYRINVTNARFSQEMLGIISAAGRKLQTEMHLLKGKARERYSPNYELTD
ncbi:hypothetical protein PR048_015894 [Dryococelus australis]|uniref:Uncharacterized protein n=1 Tax=Dryococelus australis TaxID=614101 RepID=A0ABQ9HI78_9NEOP|nr:hypothetical protein PR048_015894 [Dryococelus australis]